MHGTQILNTSEISDLGWFVVTGCQFLGIPIFLGLFRDTVLVYEICASTVDSIGIVWLPFAARR